MDRLANGYYLSVKLDDPRFPAPIYACLFEIDGGFSLIWPRSGAHGVGEGSARPVHIDRMDRSQGAQP